MVPGAEGGKRGEFMFQWHKVSVGDEENVLQMDGGDVSATM